MRNLINYFSDLFDNNNDTEYYYSLAQKEDYENRKIRLLEKVLRKEPNHKGSLEHLGDLYSIKKRIDKIEEPITGVSLLECGALYTSKLPKSRWQILPFMSIRTSSW